MVETILPLTILPLTIENAEVKKRGKSIIGPIDLTIRKGGICIIIGPNGSGKTTLLRLMNGLERVRSGRLSWACDMVLAREHQAFVFQTPIVLRRSVFENIVYPLNLKKVEKRLAHHNAKQWLEKIGLSERANLDARFLSGGEKQKLALARALVNDPQILFLDEPTANLDGKSTREIESIISEASHSGVRVVMTTHDLAQAERLAEEILFLYRGKLHEQNTATAFFNHPQTAEAEKFLRGEIVE